MAGPLSFLVARLFRGLEEDNEAGELDKAWGRPLGHGSMLPLFSIGYNYVKARRATSWPNLEKYGDRRDENFRFCPRSGAHSRRDRRRWINGLVLHPAHAHSGWH